MFAFVQHTPTVGLSRTKFTLPGVVGSLEAEIKAISLANTPVLVDSVALNRPVNLKLALVTNEDDIDDRADSNCANADLDGFSRFVLNGTVYTSMLQIGNVRIKENHWLGRECYITTFGIDFASLQFVVRIDYDLRQSNDLNFIFNNL